MIQLFNIEMAVAGPKGYDGWPETAFIWGMSAKVRTVFIAAALVVSAAGCSTNDPEAPGKLPCLPATHYAAPAGAPYAALDVRVSTPNGYVLAGTLTMPKRSVGPVPAVVLISGSHAQSRDMVSSTAEPFSRYRPFRQIADTLSRRGIAVLRLDDRGTACSVGGVLSEANSAERAKDTLAALHYLSGMKQIEGRGLGLLGMSEGANIAIMIAAKEHTLRAVVTMGASASPGWKIWEYQTRYLISLGEEMDRAKKARWLAGEDPERILEERVAEARAFVRAGKAGPWWAFFFSHDPSAVAPSVSCPTLILHGDRDSNVPVAHAGKLAEAIRSGGNTDVSVRIYRDHNHLFLPDKDGGFRRYPQLLAHTHRVPDRILKDIADWLVLRLAAEDAAAP